MYNLIAYSVYGLLVATVILYVGHLCYKEGHIYVEQLIPDDPALIHQINTVLLVGYYLVNIGYGIYGISTWEILETGIGVVESVIQHLSHITLLLAALHYGNVQFIHILIKHKSNI